MLLLTSAAWPVVAGGPVDMPALTGPPAIRHWTAATLKTNATGVLLTTPSHLFKVVRVQPDSATTAESHEGTSDIFFVESGGGAIIAGGTIDGASALPDMPGERRGTAISGGRSYDLKPNAMINLPPSTPYLLRAGASGLSVVQLRVNVGMHPWSAVQTQQTTLRPTAEHPQVTVPLNTDQGGIVYWSADDVMRVHTTLASGAARGETTSDPRGIVPVPATRTHAYNFMHRVMGASGRPPGVEFHQGNTDIYFVIAGSATLMTEGTIENREPIPNRPGEERGTVITGGKGYPLRPGDVFNMPPEIAHQSLPDPGGYTYILIKVNTGHYPWSLAER
jgi:mannose-6-phosphate isomerase-like protein (cupin superfamily)